MYHLGYMHPGWELLIMSVKCEYIYWKCVQASHCRWHAGYREINCTTRAHQHRLWQTAQCDSHPERGSI